ncbi:MAG: hypothetical protein PWQ59_2355 [Thermoanaerobacterium sp.]|jgi:hypothetical protein|nr:hypothetical protein [Thermoanaerobacterium sp.]MDK2877948.1 hypothetical protein [Thermoanaerobacteraceae bacterium]MDN5300786.1 hypothetical protein [Thermoanaerobacteraceae bacterium]
MGWKYAYASVTGTSHSRSGTPCQDSSCCEIIHTSEGEPVLVAVASDGAGSARYSEIGSKLVCSLFIEEMNAFFNKGFTVSNYTREYVEEWLIKYQSEVSKLAKMQGSVIRDYACTILAAIIGREEAVFFQIGDGAIVVSSREESDNYCWVFWPQKGEYENVTYFITDFKPSNNCLDYDNIEKSIDEVAIFTDGLQRFALHYKTQTAYTPFFRPFFTSLRDKNEGYCDEIAKSLAVYLNSNRVNERTDDDKTLVLATRIVGGGNSI